MPNHPDSIIYYEKPTFTQLSKAAQIRGMPLRKLADEIALEWLLKHHPEIAQHMLEMEAKGETFLKEQQASYLKLSGSKLAEELP